MKKLTTFLGIVAVILALTGCKSDKIPEVKSYDAYASIIVLDDTAHDIIVDVDEQEFHTKTLVKDNYRNKKDLQYVNSKIRIAWGTHQVQVMTRDRKVLYEKKMIISNADVKVIEL